jgi:hypothetical protein
MDNIAKLSAKTLFPEPLLPITTVRCARAFLSDIGAPIPTLKVSRFHQPDRT